MSGGSGFGGQAIRSEPISGARHVRPTITRAASPRPLPLQASWLTPLTLPFPLPTAYLCPHSGPAPRALHSLVGQGVSV